MVETSCPNCFLVGVFLVFLYLFKFSLFVFYFLVETIMAFLYSPSLVFMSLQKFILLAIESILLSLLSISFFFSFACSRVIKASVYFFTSCLDFPNNCNLDYSFATFFSSVSSKFFSIKVKFSLGISS